MKSVYLGPMEITGSKVISTPNLRIKRSHPWASEYLLQIPFSYHSKQKFIDEVLSDPKLEIHYQSKYIVGKREEVPRIEFPGRIFVFRLRGYLYLEPQAIWIKNPTTNKQISLEQYLSDSKKLEEIMKDSPIEENTVQYSHKDLSEE